jgi:hypothetical protein
MSTNNSKTEESESESDNASRHHSSEESNSSKHHHHSSNEESKEQSDINDTADLTRKMKKAMDMINTSNDPRMNLLNALSPYLNHERQKKLQKAVKLIRLGGLTKLLDDSEEHLI